MWNPDPVIQQLRFEKLPDFPAVFFDSSTLFGADLE